MSRMEFLAASTMCRLQAEACNVDRDDLWKLHGDEFYADAREVLSAVGAPELLEAVQELKQLLDMVLVVSGGLPPDANGPAAKALAAIRKATGTTHD